MNSNKSVFLIIIGILSIVFSLTRFYDLPNRYLFEHDQEQTANSAYNLLKNRQPSLIGQETSVGGLFVGPFLWWYQSLIMGAFGLNPLALVYAGSIASLAAVILLFTIVNKLTNKVQGLIAVSFYTLSPTLLSMDLSANALSYITFSSLLSLYLGINIFIYKKYNLLPFLTLIIALFFHIHISLATLIPALFLLILINIKKFQFKNLIFSLITFSLPFATFILFEIRHSFILFKNFLSFTSSQDYISILKMLSTTQIAIDYVTSTFFASSSLNVVVITAIIIGFTYILTISKQKKLLSYILITSLSPIILFWLYSGHVIDYYFLPIVPIFIIIGSFIYYYLWKKNKILFSILLSLLIYTNVPKLVNSYNVHLSFSHKEKIVKSVINMSEKNNINIYYQMPPGIDKGYRYLFKWKGSEPVEGSSNLFILDYNTDNEFDPTNYYDTYRQKDLYIEHVGPVYLLSVKL